MSPKVNTKEKDNPPREITTQSNIQMKESLNKTNYEKYQLVFIHIQVFPEVFNYRKLIAMLLILLSPRHVKIASYDSCVVKDEFICS
jgi:hypothetical protein